MKPFSIRHRAFGASVVVAAIGVGRTAPAHDAGKDEVKVTTLSQRSIVERLDGKSASSTVVEVTIGTRSTSVTTTDSGAIR